MPVAPLVIALFFVISGQNPAASVDCATLAECRESALAAEAGQDFERFHDLAWRTVQKGPRNNPELMVMLARAQSSSGRPLDALVMLRRVADMGVAVDASADGFARVRALPAWEELERRLALGAPVAAGEPESAARIPAAPRAAEPAKPVETGKPVDPGKPVAPEKPVAAATREEPPAAPDVAAPKPAAIPAPAAEALRFTTPAFTPGGLAYDAVSRRFIVGDRHARKLTVVDEFSHHIANLAGAQATGFSEVAALEIDPREGNLWVVTADAAGDPTGKTTLHKLQLISARALAAFTPPADAGAARLTDVAVTTGGTVLALDEGGRRVFRLRPGSAVLELAVALGDLAPLSIAPAPDDVIYISHATGIRRVGPGARAGSDVTGGPELSLAGITRLRWHGRALIAIQRTPDGGHRAVRLRLGRNGRTVTALEVLDPSIDTASPSAACISGDGLYYLAPGPGGEVIVRRVALELPPSAPPVTLKD